MDIKITRKSDGQEIDPYLFFINNESDDGTASLATTLGNCKQDFTIIINGKEL